MAKRIRIGLAFADALTREGRRMLLNSQSDFDVVYEQMSATALLDELPGLELDVVIVDIRLRGMSGHQAIAKYTRRNAANPTDLPAFLLTGPFNSPTFLLEGIRSGATGVFSEEDEPETIFRCIREATQLDSKFPLAGLCQFFRSQEVEHGGNQRWKLRLVNLSEDEQKILDSIAAGSDGIELMDATGLPQTKVRWALESLQRRLGLVTRSQLALALYEAGITPI